jgi:pantoate--beta-alanine ligase
MIRVQTPSELKKILIGFRNQGLKIGFVPTMGALHPGHISLITAAKAENDKVICSIFVNPTQFNDPRDLEKYPRNLEKDSSMLNEAACDVLFIPEIKDIYPNGTAKQSEVDLGLLDQVMEGQQRPGHFKGVIQVVSLLFDLVQPDKAYFGQKDFQQVAVIRRMVQVLDYPVQIIACPIIRESDGLAMSSRNVLLTPENRAKAPLISRLLFQVKAMFNSDPLKDLIAMAKTEINKIPGMELEYFEIVDFDTLLPLQHRNPEVQAIACIAVKLGNIRLIDNVLF